MKLSNIAASLAALMLGACSCSSGSRSDGSAADTTSVSYRSGYDAALTMINTCGDSVQVQDFILEFMATNYQIELKDGKDAASNHRKGFEDAVRETDPALASSIF